VGAEQIVVLGTGGTIAGTAAQPGVGLGYRAAQLPLAQLLAAVPGLEQAARGPLRAEQLAQIDSKDMDWAVWCALAQRCAQLLASSQVRAIVITHGTDTLEETAWFLHSVLAARKPVVLTCAMRPATALAPDGPQNLRDALAVAASAGVQGVLVVAAGSVHGAQAVGKVHPYRIDAFSSGDDGPLGWVEEGVLRWRHNRPLALDNPAPVAIKKIVDAGAAPRVDIVLSHAGADGRIVDALVADGTQGIVVAATGNGTLHRALHAALERAQRAGVVVRVATRCSLGQLLVQADDPFPSTPGLSPVKARIALQLQLLGA
jgi:L-asparaginase